MSIKAILTAASLLAGSTSLVLADPPYQHGDDDQSGLSFSIGPGGVYVGPNNPAPEYPYYSAPYAPAPYPQQPYAAPPAYPVNPYQQYPQPYQPYANSPPGYAPQSGFVNGQQYVDLDGAVGRRLTLYGTGGQSWVRSVEIHYADGDVQRVRIHQRIDPNNPRIDVSVGQEPIQAIVIQGGGAGVSAGVS